MENKYDYWLFKYLWLVMVIPKEAQFVVLLGLGGYLYYKSGRKLSFVDDISKFVLIYVAINLVSIAINSFNVSSISRIAASLNTAAIWVVGVVFYRYYKTREIDWSKCGKYLFYNLSILLGLNILMMVLVALGFTHLSIAGLELYIDDWFNGVHTYRLQAFLEYSNLVVMLFFLSFPLAYRYLKGKVEKTWQLVAGAILLFVPVYNSNSRMGIVLGGLMVLWVIYENLETKSDTISRLFTDAGKKIKEVLGKNRRLSTGLLALGAIVAVIVIVVITPKAYGFVMDFVNGRSGSSNTRFLIYRTSILKAIDDNFLIGSGIKVLASDYPGASSWLGEFPLGSHSSYIGFFYKTGLLGLGVIMIALFRIVKAAFLKHFNKNMIILLGVVAIFLAMALEDIDGADWLLVLFMAINGIYLREHEPEIGTK